MGLLCIEDSVPQQLPQSPTLNLFLLALLLLSDVSQTCVGPWMGQGQMRCPIQVQVLHYHFLSLLGPVACRYFCSANTKHIILKIPQVCTYRYEQINIHPGSKEMADQISESTQVQFSELVSVMRLLTGTQVIQRQLHYQDPTLYDGNERKLHPWCSLPTLPVASPGEYQPCNCLSLLKLQGGTCVSYEFISFQGLLIPEPYKLISLSHASRKKCYYLDISDTQQDSQRYVQST